MNVLAVCERPQVIPFKPQEVSVQKMPTASPESRTEGCRTESSKDTRVLKEVSTNVKENSQKNRSHETVAAVIKVISAGGGGANALNRMIEARLSGVEFISVNTDIQDLFNKSRAGVKVQIGAKVTGGRGAGGKPEKGESAAIEDQDAIKEVVAGADMVFITAGMGGGTGTGSAHVIAKIAKQSGALTVGVVTMPFDFEGRYKMMLAEEGLKKLRAEVDTLIIIRNQHLFRIIDNSTPLDKAYLLADEILCQGVQGISEIITETGFQNTDFADVQTVMLGKGEALMGIGSALGENRALEAVNNAIDNPLLEDTSIDGATGVLINIAGPETMTLVEINNIIKTVKEKCDPDVHLIHGIRIDNAFENSIQVTVIATGFQSVKLEETKKPAVEKEEASETFNYDEYVKRFERNKRPDFLPPRDYQDDLDVPTALRNYKAEEKTNIEPLELE